MLATRSIWIRLDSKVAFLYLLQLSKGNFSIWFKDVIQNAFFLLIDWVCLRRFRFSVDDVIQIQHDRWLWLRGLFTFELLFFRYLRPIWHICILDIFERDWYLLAAAILQLIMVFWNNEFLNWTWIMLGCRFIMFSDVLFYWLEDWKSECVFIGSWGFDIRIYTFNIQTFIYLIHVFCIGFAEEGSHSNRIRVAERGKSFFRLFSVSFGHLILYRVCRKLWPWRLFGSEFKHDFL